LFVGFEWLQPVTITTESIPITTVDPASFMVCRLARPSPESSIGERLLAVGSGRSALAQRGSASLSCSA
jgi:hypothetical protein